eukprot:s1737_g3.t1
MDALRRPLGPGPTRKPVRRKREVRHDVILGGATQEEEEEVTGRQVPLVQELAPGNVTLSQEVMKRVLMRDKAGLQAADAFLEQIGNELARVDNMLESRISSRSSLILHKAGIPADCDVPELTPMGCQKWLEVFGHSRLMLILFLGPGYGRLEFQPLDSDSIDPYEVDVGPGTLAIVRADGVSHGFFSTARSLADASATWRRRFGVPLVTTPVCRDLMDWAKERWELARRQTSLNQDDAADLPLSWQRLSNQVFQVGPQIVVRGTSCKFPSSYNDAGYWCGMQAGCDLIEEVPFCRWDHSPMFDGDPESWKWAKTNSKHGAFIDARDGIELFDNRFFGISPVESRGMDPAQRHILETSYEALYYSGYTKKSLMRSLLGVYVGAAATEMNYMPATACSSGTGGASSITSNRISFCLGMQGPSYTIDAQGASSLSALNNADMSLRLQTEHYKPNTAALVGGAYLMITGTTWIMMSAKGVLSAQGRCFCFDQSAEGMAKGEGIANLVLEREEDAGKDGGSKPTHGTIASTFANHTGRGASLTAPNGLQEGELVLQATRAAALTPSSVDAMLGSSIDAVEAQVLRRALRGHTEVEAPLSLTSGFSGSGMALECAGMAQILKVLASQKFGAITPLQHLHQLNPEIEQPTKDDAALFASEVITIEGLSSYCGSTGKGIGGTMVHAGLNQTAESCEEPSVEEDESPNSRRPAPPAARGLSHGFATGRGQRLMQAELAKSSSSPVAKEKEPAKMSHTSPAPAPRTARAPLGLARPPLSPATPCQADEGISANAASLEPGSLNKGSGQRSVPGSELRAADSGSRDASSTGASRPASPSTHVSEESGAASTAQPGDSTGQRTSWPSQARSTPTVPLEKAYAVYIPSLEGSVPFNEREMQAQAAVPVLSERSPRYQSVAAASKQASKEPVPTRSSTPTSPRRTKKVLAQPLSSPAGPKSPRRPSPVTELQAPKAEISASSSCAASVAGEEGIPSGSASARAAGTAWTKRFELVKSRGRSSSPPARDKLESWRAGHIPPDCIIKRRRQKKGPKEKLLILPFLACEDDPRFSHLFETLEAKQPEILSESLAPGP